MLMNLFDTTLRDGGNVVGDGFSADLTVSMVKALLAAGIPDIELGNCKGLGAYDKLGATNCPTDAEYLACVKPYVSQGCLGMFLQAQLADEALVKAAADAGLSFLRVGAAAGDGQKALAAIKMVKDAGLVCRYSQMKAYILSAEELANEARMLQDAGVDAITIMDSAGTMYPQETAEYVAAMKKKVTIPVGFHGHSNLGLSQANALVAVANGADEVDCGLLGMARSAGNCSTELAIATLQKEGYLADVDLYGLLDYLDDELIPAMKAYNYRPAVMPVDLILGLSGCHSSFLGKLRNVAAEKNVSLYRLIVEVSRENRKNPSEELMYATAENLKN